MIHLSGLNKSFKTYEKEAGVWGSLRSFWHRRSTTNYAVKDFNMEVAEGEIVGLLGPNGAGKTTLMKMMAGIIAPTSGTLSIMGYEPFQRPLAFRQQIALVMGQKSQLWWDIPAMDAFLLLQRYYQLDHKEFQDSLSELKAVLGLERELAVPIRKLSLGERMKCELMASLLHKPRLLYLDEPTIGLDLVAQVKVREFLKSYQKQHRITIILTSHYMADVEALCDRVVLIQRGTKRFDGPIQEFTGLLGHNRSVTIHYRQAADPSLPLFQNLEANWNDDHTKVAVMIPEKELGARTKDLLAHQPVLDFHTEKLPIESVMTHLLKKDLLAAGKEAKEGDAHG